MPNSTATFGIHVVCIVCPSSDEKVFGIDTGTNVTMMANIQSIWDSTVRKLVRITMSNDIAGSIPDAPISVFVDAASVYPASCAKIGVNWPILVNLVPKVLRQLNDFPLAIMSLDETFGLTLNPSVSGMSSCGDRSNLPTSTFA